MKTANALILLAFTFATALHASPEAQALLYWTAFCLALPEAGHKRKRPARMSGPRKAA